MHLASKNQLTIRTMLVAEILDVSAYSKWASAPMYFPCLKCSF